MQVDCRGRCGAPPRSCSARDRPRPANRSDAPKARPASPVPQPRSSARSKCVGAAECRGRPPSPPRAAAPARDSRAAPAGRSKSGCLLIEQPPHIDRGHRRRDLAGAEPRQLQPRAVIVLGVGVARLLARRRPPRPGRPDCREWRRARTRRWRNRAPARPSAPGCRRRRRGRRAPHDRAPICSGGRRSDRRMRRTAVHLSLRRIYRISQAQCVPRTSLSCRRRPACAASSAAFHIDPTRPVDKALITHGHSDHARPGHGAVLATPGDARSDAAALRRELRRQHAGGRAMARPCSSTAHA